MKIECKIILEFGNILSYEGDNFKQFLEWLELNRFKELV